MTRSSATGVCQRRSRAQLAAVLVLLVFGAAPLALAQTTAPPKKPKKGAKPAASASASATAAPEPPPPPPPPPEPEPAASASAEPSEPAEGEANPNDSNYTKEDPAKKYNFVGVRYRGTIVPQFMENLFVNNGATVYSNTIGVEYDMRQDGKSLIPWAAFTSYSTGDILFLQKGQPDQANEYSIVNSGLAAVYLGIDELWSMPLAEHLDFEYGFGVGIGVVFGSLQNNWVYPATAQTPGAIKSSSSGVYYQECQAISSGPSCDPSAHQNASVAKVGGYIEKNWFQGGSVPVIFPHIAIPQFSLRYKPLKVLEARASLGFSITGVWFGLSVDYGLEKKDEAGTDKGKAKDKNKPADKDKDKKTDPGDQDKKSDGSLDWRDTL